MKVKIFSKNTIRYGGEYLHFTAGQVLDTEDVELVKILTSYNIAEIVKIDEPITIQETAKPIKIEPVIEEIEIEEPKEEEIEEDTPKEFKPSKPESKKSIMIDLN